MQKKIEILLDKGVKIPNPHTLEIGEEVDTDRISGNNVVIYSGCKIYGKSTLILQGTRLGYESPVTVDDCQVGPGVSLKGGFFQRSVFLKKVSMGYGAHVREGTILEEQASVAHTVGLKQTILFPFVTLGSLINFCDCFMSGGTSRKDHSEVGSSYIHFNYTPNQDKATPSLIGDVPGGVMLNQMPIFLGGQGGLVGPCRLAFGIIIAAGTIWRKDELRQNRLLFEGGRSGNIPFTPGVHINLRRIITNNIFYLANLMALMQWYTHVRSQFVSKDFPESLLEGLRQNLNRAIDERIKRLKPVCKSQEGEWHERWQALESEFQTCRRYEGDIQLRDMFLEEIHTGISTSGKDYIAVIKSLDNVTTGTSWLQSVVEHITDDLLKIIP